MAAVTVPMLRLQHPVRIVDSFPTNAIHVIAEKYSTTLQPFSPSRQPLLLRRRHCRYPLEKISSQSPSPGLLSRTNNERSVVSVELLSFTMIMTNITQHLHDTFVMMYRPTAQRRCRIVVVWHHCRHRRRLPTIPFLLCMTLLAV